MQTIDPLLFFTFVLTKNKEKSPSANKSLEDEEGRMFLSSSNIGGVNSTLLVFCDMFFASHYKVAKMIFLIFSPTFSNRKKKKLILDQRDSSFYGA